ncbi:MAG TPA: prepilin-type N-terminal cleavage/methylation domain-containing protein, partial [Phycisphaerae bacterium]|nr:prepilin-type N-terminal cleavage/methylation domain-containing protein [Phycisphaerae bacterium]
MKNRRAFTLIELLVVVSIIAVLIAILIPSISKARKLARTSVCLTNERYLVMSYRLYYTDQGVVLHSTGHGNAGAWDYQLLGAGAGRKPDGSIGEMSYGEYYTKNGRGGNLDKARWCPESTTDRRSSSERSVGNASLCWDCRVGLGGGSTGSYAMNNWVYTPDSFTASSVPGHFPQYFYSIKNAKSESVIPVFVDAAWHDIIPTESDLPSVNLGNAEGRPNETNLCDAVLDRHLRAVNVSFWDAHVETVKLANLPLINWHVGWSRGTPF